MTKRFFLFFLIISMALALPVAAIGQSAEEETQPGQTKKSGTGTAAKPAGKTIKKSAKASPAGKKGPAGKAAKKKAGAAKKKQASAAAVAKPSAPALVSEIRHWSNPDYTRIAVTLDREARFEYHQLPQNEELHIPPRLYIDIEGARKGPGVKDIAIGDGLLKTARVGQYSSDTVRVVLDLDSMKEYKIFTFADPFRIIIDARGERKTEISQGRETAISPLPTVQAGTPLPPTETPKSTTKPAKPAAKPVIGKIRRIVVDPGHGGHDPGAIGAGGTREKDVVLQMGLKLARRLREELGLDVVLTRSTDVFIELQERTAIANQVGADLFVSIHANAALNRTSSGIETYYLNLAKTEKVAQLAAKENGTSLEKVSLLQAVLFDLMANYKLNDSAHLADEVQKAVYHKVSARYTGVKNLGVKQGPFYVLVGATMPSILVETAFVTNEREEARLNDQNYQESTVAGIVEGIREYMASLK
ncbi:MAG TPA: N-acetylmuramoyl-L-alanine amidase [Geobacteraceae bacterium]|nr:N-acetylmuramoyl-L-alanine amidase [Geobacteraceae bacterium]